MAEDTADTLKKEGVPTSRVERIKAGVVKFVESQLPPAHAERYMCFYDAVQRNLGGKALEISTKLRPTMENVAKAAGWGTTIAEVAISTAAIYGGVQLALQPQLIGAMWGAGVALGEKAVVVGTAAAVGAYRYVVDASVAIWDRVSEVARRIIQGAPVPESPPVNPDPDSRYMNM